MTMRLEQVRDWHRAQAVAVRSSELAAQHPDFAERQARRHDECANAIDAHLSQPQPVAQGEAVAWRVRIGDSDMWGYADSNIDAEFIGKQSGLPYVVQELATIPTGHRLVPVEPTEAMQIAARDWSQRMYGKPVGYEASEGCWKAMLNAAPTGGG